MAAKDSRIIIWHSLSQEESLSRLATNRSGLSQSDAASRAGEYGPNEIIERRKKGDLDIFLDQFRSFLIGILLVAIVLSALLGELVDAIVISVIVILNASLGFIQIKKAEEAVAALKRIAAPSVKVIRDGQVHSIASRELVPGDVVVIAAGDRIPADCRILQQMNLKVDESILTGESVPVVKHENALKPDAPLHARKNMLFAGTTAVYGRCEAVVVLTGMSTEFGRIAETLQSPEEETPLQVKIDALGKQLGMVFIAISAIVFVLGIAASVPFVNMFVTALALAVAAVPEGLLASITIALAIGIDRMAKKRAIVKKLTAVEGLGSVTVICSDKTGTLTVNEMTVRKVWTPDLEADVTGEGYRAEGTFTSEGKRIEPGKIEGISAVLKAGLMCNDAFAEDEYIGDPTEIALLVSAKKAGISDIRKSIRRDEEVPFDSERKMMSVLYKTKGDGHSIWTKGAVENIIRRCSSVMKGGRVRKMTAEDRKEIFNINKKYAAKSFRVLAFATKQVKEGSMILENDLVFLGLQAMIDPPRPEAKAAIAQCRAAGVKVVMVTGDHKDTAVAVAKELKLMDGDLALSGEELDKLSDYEFDRVVEGITVYARVSPEHKVRITDAFKRKGHIVAMTGDGINDAPALKRADVGVAMGQTGTDVTREVADMVVSDDNFATIVSAISEGRGIYDNIRKTIAFLLSGNIGEVAILLVAAIAGLPLPLIAIQILWINLVSDGLPAIALSVDPINKDVMSRKPRPSSEKLTDRMRPYIIDYPAIMTIGVISLFSLSLHLHGDLQRAQTVAFTTVIMFEIFQSFSCRSLERPVGAEVFKNRYLLLATALSLLLQFAILYGPLNETFHVVPLTQLEWMEIAVVSLIGFIYLEIVKMLGGNKIVNRGQVSES